MREIIRSALLPLSAEQMFDVVNDVVRYQEYLPWCSASEVVESTRDVMVAKLTLERAGFRQQFTTKNLLRRPHRIDLTFVEGPFSTLEGFWTFQQLGEEGCRVEMRLRFDFSSSMLNLAFGRVFEQVADNLVDAFCDRARSIYEET